jgi:hypothetical protein
MYDTIQHVSHIRSSPKEKLLPHIGSVRIVGGNSHSTPVVSSNDMTYNG